MGRRPRSWRAAGLLACSLLVAAIQLAAGDDAPAEEGPVLVTCGSVVKLEAGATRHYLHSHEVSYGYGSGSGQQSVTGYPERNSADSLWAVRVADCPQGSPIAKGQEVRLQHLHTRRWLHSHLFQSPLSRNQEVSCFGDDNTSDAGDVWRVDWEGGAAAWQRDAPVTLRHKATEMYLCNHAVKYQRPIPGHTEVFAQKGKTERAVWRATEGMYFAAREEAAAAKA